MKQQLNILSSKEDRSLRTGPHVRANVQFDPLPKPRCRLCSPFHGSDILWWLWPLPAGCYTSAKMQKQIQECCEERINGLKVDLASELPQKLHPTERPWDVICCPFQLASFLKIIVIFIDSLKIVHCRFIFGLWWFGGNLKIAQTNALCTNPVQ